MRSGRLLTTREVMRILNASYRTVYYLIDTGELTAIRIGKGMLRVSESDVEALINRGKVRPKYRKGRYAA